MSRAPLHLRSWKTAVATTEQFMMMSNIIFNWHHLKWCSESRMAHSAGRCLSRLLSPRISSSPPLLTSHVGGTKEDEHPDPPFVILGTETSFKLAHWDWAAGHSQEDRRDKEAQVREKSPPPPNEWLSIVINSKMMVFTFCSTDYLIHKKQTL